MLRLTIAALGLAIALLLLSACHPGSRPGSPVALSATSHQGVRTP